MIRPVTLKLLASPLDRQAMAEQLLGFFRGWDGPGRHVWSPFAVKLEARLRFAGAKYIPAIGSLLTAPRGKLCSGEQTGPSAFHELWSYVRTNRSWPAYEGLLQNYC